MVFFIKIPKLQLFSAIKKEFNFKFVNKSSNEFDYTLFTRTYKVGQSCLFNKISNFCDVVSFLLKLSKK